MQQQLSDYDIKEIIKTTSVPAYLPGSPSYHSKVVGTAEQSGMAVLVQNYLAEYAHDTDTSPGQQTWLQRRNCRGVVVEFCDIPPCD